MSTLDPRRNLVTADALRPFRLDDRGLRLLDQRALLPKIKSPILLIHGEQDGFIPPSHSKALKALVKPARLLLVPGAAHNDVHKFDLYLKELGGVLAGL